MAPLFFTHHNSFGIPIPFRYSHFGAEIFCCAKYCRHLPWELKKDVYSPVSDVFEMLEGEGGGDKDGGCFGA